MPVSIVCNSCLKKLKVSEKLIGKTAKCPACSAMIRIEQPPVAEPAFDFSDSYEQEDEYLPPARVQRKAAPAVPPPAELPAIVPRQSFRFIVKNDWAARVFISLVCLAIGYFAGREHVKYQLAQGLQKMGEAFTAGLGNAFNANPATQPAGVKQAPPVETSVPEIPWKESYRTETFEVVIKSAVVGPVPLKDTIRGTIGESENPQLMINFEIKNVHDRKILNFSGDNAFGSKLTLSDDVDNGIRGVDFGFSNQVVGELKSSDDIQPGESRTHVQVFTVPPVKTKQLFLTLDCKAFGGEGVVKFLIPATQIAGFNK